MSVTATGTGEVKVTPANPYSNASIVAAVEAAERAATPAAMDAAHARAELYAEDAGLTLGGMLSVTDAGSGTVLGIGPYFPGEIVRPSGLTDHTPTSARRSRLKSRCHPRPSRPSGSR